MPTELENLINRAFREFRRYTGDGMPGEPVNAPLPIGDPQSGANSPKKSEVRAAFIATAQSAADVSRLEADVATFNEKIIGVNAGIVRKATWVDLAAQPGTSPGQPGEVVNDAGIHTDPVVGGDVANAGLYSWSTSPAGWKRVGDTGVATLEREQDDLLKATREHLLSMPAERGLVSTEWLRVLGSDLTGNVAAGINRFGQLRAQLLDFPGVPTIAPGWQWAVVDLDGYVIFGVNTEGRFVSGSEPDVSVFTKTIDGVPAVYALTGSGDVTPISFGENPAYGPYVSGSDIKWVEEIAEAFVPQVEDATAVTAIHDSATKLTHFQGHGQSLIDGDVSIPAASSANVMTSWAQMFNIGTRPRYPSGNVQIPTDRNSILSLVDLHETNAQSPASAMIAQIIANGGREPTEALLYSGHGRGGNAYATLKKGNDAYANILRSVRRARIIAGLNGLEYEYGALTWIHGNANSSANLSTYKGYIDELYADLSADLPRYTGSSDPLLMSVDQFSAWTQYSRTTSDVPLAALQASLDNPNIICMGPHYRLLTVDGVHPTAAMFELLGAYHGRAIEQTRAGNRWVPLYHYSAVRTGSTIVVKFHVPEPPIVIDTSVISNPGNYGVEFFQTGGAAVTINSVTVTGADEITVALSGTPTGTDQKLGVAITGTVNNWAGPTTGPRSCIRDSSPDVSVAGLAMPNYACHWITPVTT